MSIEIRIVFAALAAAFTLVAAVTPARAQDGGSNVTGNVAVFYGAKLLDDNDWAPVDEHEEVGLVVDMASSDLLLGFEVRALRSKSDTKFESGTGLFVQLETSELDIGVRKTTSGTPAGYLAGGVTKIDADLTFTGVGTASDSAYGLWVAIGAYIVVAGPFAIGVDGMVSSAEVDFDTPVKADVGGTHVNFWAGFHF